MIESIAVIGAGAAGLAACKELTALGLSVTVFEQSHRVGGIWVYEDRTDTDPTGHHPEVFSSLYASLRTNLPRDLMAFLDYPFDSSGGGDDGWARYPHHSKVLVYLENFVRDFNLTRHIRFNQPVTQITPINGQRWQVSTASDVSEFDAVVVCNGHYSKPRVPTLSGLDAFNGSISHSHNYRQPDSFREQSVCLWGTAASGSDISREIATVAREVFWCGNAFKLPLKSNDSDVIMGPTPEAITAQGYLEFAGGIQAGPVDHFMYCTGYEYEFPFLDESVVNVVENRVHDLYLDILPPAHPTLAFIGIPYLIVPFPLFARQARWFGKFLLGQIGLPEDPHAWINAKATALGDEPARHYHRLGEHQAAYMDDLASQCGDDPLPDWFHALTAEAQQSRLADPAGFRDKPMRQHGPTRTAPGQQPP